MRLCAVGSGSTQWALAVAVAVGIGTKFDMASGMPRKKVILTHEFPYHITARSNNREWFYLSKDQCWEIFCDLLQKVTTRFHLQVHAFVLMDNHYHMIVTPSQRVALPRVFEWFQRSANRTINDRAGRINHLFGGPYKPTLICRPEHYYHAYRYVYRNPVTAKLVATVTEYRYSTFVDDSVVPLVTPITGIASLIPKDPGKVLEYLERDYEEGEKQMIDQAMRKTEFKLPSRVCAQLRKTIFNK